MLALLYPVFLPFLEVDKQERGPGSWLSSVLCRGHSLSKPQCFSQERNVLWGGADPCGYLKLWGGLGSLRMSSLPRAMSVSPELTPQKGHLLRSTENASPDSERCSGGTSPSENVSTFSEPCVAKRCVWGKLQQNTDVVIFLAVFFRFKRIFCPLYRGVISCRSFYLTR